MTGSRGETPLRRFARSMEVDYERWHDGVGYDLEALGRASADERAAIESMLLARTPPGWREIEALAALSTPASRRALAQALQADDVEVALAVLRHAPALASDAVRTAVLVRALETASFYGGLSQALDLVADHHPAEVVAALLRGVLDRDGEVAVHLAAMLLFVHGRAEEPFDMEQRPFLLRFNTEDPAERRAALAELRERVGPGLGDTPDPPPPAPAHSA